MEEQPNQEEEASEEAREGGEEQASSEEIGVSSRKGRLRRAFGFLGSAPFWGGLAVGTVVLGAGVVIGLAAGGWMDRDGRSDDDQRGKGVGSFRVNPDGEWSGRMEEKGRWEKGSGWKGRERGDFPGRGDFVPDEVWERVENLIEEVEDLVEKVAEYVDGEEDFGSLLDRFFGSEWSFEGDFWEEDGRQRPFEDGKRPGAESSDDFWGDELPGGPFGRSGFPFGELLPGLMVLEECDLDLVEFPEVMEDLPDTDRDELVAEEDLEEIFDAIAEMFREACEEGPDN